MTNSVDTSEDAFTPESLTQKLETAFNTLCFHLQVVNIKNDISKSEISKLNNDAKRAMRKQWRLRIVFLVIGILGTNIASWIIDGSIVPKIQNLFGYAQSSLFQNSRLTWIGVIFGAIVVYILLRLRIAYVKKQSNTKRKLSVYEKNAQDRRIIGGMAFEITSKEIEERSGRAVYHEPWQEECVTAILIEDPPLFFRDREGEPDELEDSFETPYQRGFQDTSYKFKLVEEAKSDFQQVIDYLNKNSP